MDRHPGSLRPRTGGPKLGSIFSFLCPEALSLPRTAAGMSPSLCCPHPFVINTILSGCLEKHIFRVNGQGSDLGAEE